MLRTRVFQALNGDPSKHRFTRAINLFIVALITLNVLVVVFETVDSIARPYGALLHTIELVSVVFFLVEYLLRLWTCVEMDEYKRPILGRLRYSVTPLALVDLFAVIPSCIPGVTFDLRFLRALRLLRLFSILKLGRYSEAAGLLYVVIKKSKEELSMTLLMVTVLLLLVSSGMYYVEHEAQPDAFASIPEALWWGVATLTTVGYGDVYPITALGRVFGSISALLCIAVFAIPTGILGSGFVEETRLLKQQRMKCPHCGKQVSNE